MQIKKHKVVAIDYTLTDESGDVIDSSEGAEPLNYLHGEGNLIAGLESALDGKSVGEEIKVSVEPGDGYGERDEELVQVVPREAFGDVKSIEPGMQFRVPAEGGDDTVVTVVEVTDEEITIDGNHPLAGTTLHFAVAIRDIRDATAEEIDHGHVHDGHEHH